MTAWNFATIWEIVADKLPDAPALMQGDRAVAWADVRPAGRRHRPHAARPRRDHQDKVAQYLYNCPEYLESMFAAFKAGLVPVNTNYRYADDELALPVGQRRRRRRRVPRHASPSASRASATASRRCRPGCGSTTAAARAPSGPSPTSRPPPRATERVVAPWGRGDDDILMIYTGGTTGMPKGVMWRQDDLMQAVVIERRTRSSPATPTTTPCATAAHRTARRLAAARSPAHARHRPVHHLHRRSSGGGVVMLLEGRHFDVDEMLDTIERRAGQHARHRGRRLRQADGAGARRRPRPVGPLQPHRSSRRRA